MILKPSCQCEDRKVALTAVYWGKEKTKTALTLLGFLFISIIVGAGVYGIQLQ